MRGIGLNTKILYSLLAVMLALALLPLVVVSWRLISINRESLATAQRNQQLVAVRTVARETQDAAERSLNRTAMYARALELSGGVEAAENDAWRRELKQRDPMLLALAVVSREGAFLLAERATDVDPAEFEAITREALAAVSSGVYVGAPRPLRTGVAAVPMGAPVYAGDRLDGAVVSLMSVRSAIRFPRAAETSVGAYYVAVTPEGLELERSSEAPRAESPGEIPVVATWVAGRGDAPELAGERDRFLSALATAELPGGHRIGVASVVDRNAAFATADRMRTHALWASSFAAVVALLVAVLFSRHVAAPLRELARGARAIAGGDFSHRIGVRSADEIGQLGEDFNRMAERLEGYVDELRKAAADSRALFIGTVRGLAAAIDGKDPYTRGHSERVADYSAAMAIELGLGAEEVEKIRIGGLMHDIGKLAIEDKILRKPAPLTDEEFEIMREHPERGTKIMSQIPQMREYISGMRYHHEMMNGKGYPLGLIGEQIPLMARIVSVADTFDAMTTNRPYQKQMPIDLVFERIKSMAGVRYDPKVVDALVAAYENGRIRLKLQKIVRQGAAVE